MNIVFHLGFHCTDGGLLIRSLLQNRARLADQGIGVPSPLAYREGLGELSTTLRGEPAAPATVDALIRVIAPDPGTHRVILSNENFLCRSNVALGPDGLYPKAMKSAWLRHCLPGHDVEFAVALRNPAGFLPDLLAGRGGPCPPRELLDGGIWLQDLRWHDVVARLVRANPGCPVTVWCHEDTPFIWGELLQCIAGVDASETLDGELDMAETIMSPGGYDRLTEFLGARDTGNADKRRRAIGAFLEAHAIDDAIEDVIDLPGWTEETVDTLTRQYEEDVEDILSIRGVNFIFP